MRRFREAGKENDMGLLVGIVTIVHLLERERELSANSLLEIERAFRYNGSTTREE